MLTGGEAFLAAFIIGISAFFGTICYGLTIVSRAISGRQRARDVEALRAEVARMRQELASTLLDQDHQLQHLTDRLRSVEQSLPALRAGAASDESPARARLQGP